MTDRRGVEGSAPTSDQPMFVTAPPEGSNRFPRTEGCCVRSFAEPSWVIDPSVLPPPPPPPPRRHPGVIVAAIAGVLVAALVLAGLVRIAGTPSASGASPAPIDAGSGDGSPPPSLDGHGRITSGPMFDRMKASLPSLPIAGATYAFAIYGEGDTPDSVLLLIHGLGAMVSAMPSSVFFSSVGDGLATAFAGGKTLNTAGGVQASLDGADHDCLPLRRDADALGVVCIFRVSGTIGMVLLLHRSDPKAALAVSEAAARAVS